MNELSIDLHCKNCKYPIENYDFCPKCGAKKITKRITFPYLISEFTNRFFNVNNSFFKTFWHLFTKPEEVIGGYINGLRKRYISAFGYFAISLTLTGFYAYIVKDRMEELISLNSTSEQQLAITQTSSDFSYQYQSLISFIIIPLLALLSRLIFINYKRYNITEHLVIYLYAYSHIVTVGSFLTLPLVFITDNLYVATLVLLPVYVLYIAYVLKRIYQVSFSEIIIKTFWCIVIGLTLFSLAILAIAILINSDSTGIP